MDLLFVDAIPQQNHNKFVVVDGVDNAKARSQSAKAYLIVRKAADPQRFLTNSTHSTHDSLHS